MKTYKHRNPNQYKLNPFSGTYRFTYNLLTNPGDLPTTAFVPVLPWAEDILVIESSQDQRVLMSAPCYAPAVSGTGVDGRCALTNT